MKKLEIKHLVGYLPYQLKIKGNTHGEVRILSGLVNETIYIVGGQNKVAWCDIFDIKPILHPISDLTKEIEINEVKFTPVLELTANPEFNAHESIIYTAFITEYADGVALNFKTKESEYLDVMYIHDAIQKLFEWHFDVYQLIEYNLAIDINTIK